MKEQKAIVFNHTTSFSNDGEQYESTQTVKKIRTNTLKNEFSFGKGFAMTSIAGISNVFMHYAGCSTVNRVIGILMNHIECRNKVSVLTHKDIANILKIRNEDDVRKVLKRLCTEDIHLGYPLLAKKREGKSFRYFFNPMVVFYNKGDVTIMQHDAYERFKALALETMIKSTPNDNGEYVMEM